MSNQDLARTDPQTGLGANEPANVLSAMMRAASDPAVDVGKLQALLAMQKEILADRAVAAFNMDFMAMKPGLPRIIPRGGVPDKTGAIKFRFIRFDDMLEKCEPIMRKWGFAAIFGLEQQDKVMMITCTLIHREGHSVKGYFPAGQSPEGTAPGMNAMQARGSATSYGQRYLLKTMLGIVAGDEDDDAQSAYESVNEQQAMDIQDALALSGKDKAAFMNWVVAQNGPHVKCIGDIPASAYAGVMKTLNQAIAKKEGK